MERFGPRLRFRATARSSPLGTVTAPPVSGMGIFGLSDAAAVIPGTTGPGWEIVTYLEHLWYDGTR
jgi:hypothetical protein